MSISIEGKNVFPIVSEERSNNYSWFEGAENIDKKVLPITKTQLREIVERNNITIDCIVNEGTVLMLHPYRPNTMVSVTKTMEEFLVQKLNDYSIVLNYLGASNQNLKARVVKKQTRSFEAKGGFSIKGTKVNGKVGKIKKVFSKVRATIIVEGTGKLNYERAKEEACKLGLQNDEFIRTLLELRHDNPITRHYTDIEIAKDFNESMDVAASIVAAAGAFNLKGNFKKNLDSREEVRIIQDITFKKAEQ